MAWELGARSMRVYSALRDRILSGNLENGTKLPSHTELSAQFGVSPMTMRQVLGRLQADRLVAIKPGLGTFVTTQQAPTVLIVDDEAAVRTILSGFVARAGYRPLAADGPAAALAALETDASIALILTDIRMPRTADGIQFIRTVRDRWANIPLAAITGYPDDLIELQGSPECPVLILSKPVRRQQIDEVLRIVLAHRPAVASL